MFREKINKIVIALLATLVTLLGLAGSALIMLMGGALVYDATNLQFYTQAVMGALMSIGGFAGFTFIIAILKFKYKKQEQHKNLMERWMMAIVMNGVMLMMVNTIWHFYITAQMSMMPPFLQLFMCSLVTFMYFVETFRLVRSEVRHVKSIRGELNAELAER